MVQGGHSISVIHVALGAAKSMFGPAPPPLKILPSFQHGQTQIGLYFLPKSCVDVRKVEVSTCYRLSYNNEIQRVSWQVQRKLKEFIQDDVFVPTEDVETAMMTAEE